MNDKSDDFGGGAPEQRALDEHLKGIGRKSNSNEVKAAVKNALGDSWSRAELKAALEARGVSPGKIKDALPPAPKPHVAAATGLAPGYFRKDDESVWTFVSDSKTGDPTEAAICSPIRAIHHTTDGEGDDASTVIETINIHGERRRTRLKAAVARTDVRTAIGQLIERGLIPAYRSEKLHAEILDAVLNAVVPFARHLTKTGHCSFRGVKAFALPSGVIGAQLDVEIIWDGETRLCRAGKAGALDEWLATVAAPCDGNPIPMVATATALASPAIPYLPQNAEINTMVHLVEVTTTGKTTTLRVAASSWGKGADTSDPESFVDSWLTTGNFSENLLAGHNHVGICLDEMKLHDPKSAETWANLLAMGRGKGRQNRDSTSRRSYAWELFPLSSGNVTLADRANDANSTKRRTAEGGSEVRVINIPAFNIFSNLHGCADAKTFAERLAVSAATTYGHAGPAFVEWLLANEAEARRRLEKYLGLWRQVVDTKVLPPAPSAQARRVATRLGSIACAGALAADVLKLPWTVGGEVKPAVATLEAFAKVLKLWLAENGGGAMSTELAGLNDEFRNLYESQRQHFYTAEDSALLRPEPCWGYREVGAAVGEKVQVQLLHVDVRLGTFSDPKGLGWNKVQTKQFIRGLRDRDLLLPSDAEHPSNTRTIDGRKTRIYRIKGEFFDG